MRVCLSTLNGLGSTKSLQPSLAILSLAAANEKAGIDTDLVDVHALSLLGKINQHSSQFVKDAARLICGSGAHCLCFSTRCDTYPYVIEVARLCKRLQPRSTIILGGPHATSTDLLTLKRFPFIDYIVRGEGELSFPALLMALKRGEDPHTVQGVSYRTSKGDVVRNPDRPLIKNLDGLPLPAYNHYYAAYNELAPAFSDVEIGRGCPFACNFCFTSKMWQHRYRLYGTDRIIKQIKYLREQFGQNTFRLVHDNFILKRSEKIEKFLARFSDELHGVNWSCSTRIDCLDIDILYDLARSGCTDVYFGIESGSKKIQEQLNKRFKLSRVLEVLDVCGKNKIKATLSFIVGFPDEDRSDLEATLRFALECSVKRSVTCTQFHALSPTFGTPMYNSLSGRLQLIDAWSNHSGDIEIKGKPIRELIRKHMDIFSNFYLINNHNYPMNLPYLVQEIFGCFINFFPMTLYIVTHELNIKISSLVEKAQDFMWASSQKKWKYGRDPKIDMTLFVKSLYKRTRQNIKPIRPILDYETSVYEGYLRARRRPNIKSVNSGNATALNIDDLKKMVPALPYNVGLFSVNGSPKKVFQMFLERCPYPDEQKLLGENEYYLYFMKNDGSACSIHKLQRLEYRALRMIDGRKTVDEILSRLFNAERFYHSDILANHLLRMFYFFLQEKRMSIVLK